MIIGTTLASDNSSRFKKNILKNIKINHIIDNQIIAEKIQYDINREAAKISALSLRKIINMNILQVKKCDHLIKVEQWIS